MDSATTVVLGPAKQCIGCPAVGLPEPGHSFYVCIPCLDRLADALDKFCIGGPDAESTGAEECL